MSCTTMKIDRKVSLGSFVINLFLLKLQGEFLAEDRLQAPPLQWGHLGRMKAMPLEERSPQPLP